MKTGRRQLKPEFQNVPGTLAHRLEMAHARGPTPLNPIAIDFSEIEARIMEHDGMKYFSVAVWQQSETHVFEERVLKVMARDALMAKTRALKMFKQDSSYNPKLPIRTKVL